MPYLEDLQRGTSRLDLERTASATTSCREDPQHDLAIERIDTYRVQQQATIGSTRSRVPREQWLSMGAGKPYPPDLPNAEGYIVEFEGSDDPAHPQNWPFRLSLRQCRVRYGSAVFATAADGVIKEFGFSHEVADLGTTLYVLGFAAGPTIWAPASELIGRRWPLLVGMFGFSVFTIACATAKDAQTLFLTRFFSGFFAASIIALVPATMSDIFMSADRGVAIAMYTVSVFTGPFISPFIGGFTAASYLGWRWTLYVPAIVGFFGLALMAIFCKETYPPVVLIEKASILRRQTHNWGIHARQDEIEVDFRELVTKNMARPFLILFTEPIAFCLTVYMSFLYGLAYAFLEAFPLVFTDVHGMPAGVSGLPFIALIIGQIFGAVFVLGLQPTFRCKSEENHGNWVPEWRLPPCILGGAIFSAGLFWFGWTGWSSSIHWMAPTASGVFIGFGLTSIFMSCFNYLLDSYSNFAASAFAANTMMRSMVGACFPLFTTQMFNNMGIQWAGTLLGFMAAIMVPIPVLFYVYGGRLRRMSKLAPVQEPIC
ncbi:MFS general substrate transporter [Penicillium longicatenatum]|uniref:MFS general substrate transporter n=1 Tax=Penicillium longicatenatum TaxID=1561947 RepID=UPI00254767D4|nr:MFS general substrate transporter [Penicillium longicatenatum]KAJ5651560.1 MFS general substrate transporter [Penicillium longicatenatum]